MSRAQEGILSHTKKSVSFKTPQVMLDDGANHPDLNHGSIYHCHLSLVALLRKLSITIYAHDEKVEVPQSNNLALPVNPC